MKSPTASFPKDQLNYFQHGLLAWFSKEKRDFPWRRKSASKYEMIVSEVLLQRTRAETVEGFFKRFVREYPSWRKLSKATESQLEEFLHPIGLWRRRASSLKKLAAVMAKRNGRFPRTRDEIESLPGVGQYIANTILLFCHGDPQPLLDTNMARVLERFFGPRKLADIRYDPYLQSLAREVVAGCDNPALINWAILDHASAICRLSTPLCEICPVGEKCKFAQANMKN